MSDLISREAAVHVLCEENINRPLDSDRWLISDIYKKIEELPTIDAVPRQKYEEDMENAFAHGYTDAESKYRKMIADGELVEVVRCKDCKFFVSDMEWCEADDEHPASPDAFCSWAERRTDE